MLETFNIVYGEKSCVCVGLHHSMQTLGDIPTHSSIILASIFHRSFPSKHQLSFKIIQECWVNQLEDRQLNLVLPIR